MDEPLWSLHWVGVCGIKDNSRVGSKYFLNDMESPLHVNVRSLTINPFSSLRSIIKRPDASRMNSIFNESYGAFCLLYKYKSSFSMQGLNFLFIFWMQGLVFFLLPIKLKFYHSCAHCSWFVSLEFFPS